MRSCTLVVAAAASLVTGCGITGNFRHDPGYADFRSPGPWATDRQIGLSLGPLPLKLARLVLDEDDEPELHGILKGLRAVRVYI
jgi:hypothetical protein